MTKQIDKIMEQAQVFASAWSLVGGRFDGGNAMDDAEVAKNELRQMVAEALAEQPAQQEPVAWLHTKIESVAVPHRPADLDKHPDRWEALYRTPPCPTCEALARTVMMDQTGRDA